MTVHRSLAATWVPTEPAGLPPAVVARPVEGTTVADLEVVEHGAMVMTAAAPAHGAAATDDVTTGVGRVHVPADATLGREVVTGRRGVRRSARTAEEVVWRPRVRDCPNPGSRTR